MTESGGDKVPIEDGELCAERAGYRFPAVFCRIRFRHVSAPHRIAVG